MRLETLHELPFPESFRTAYRSIRSLYRQTRAIRNRLLNLLDRPILILLYHRVTKLPGDPEMLAVSPDNFRRHLEFLKQHYRIARFEEEWSSLEKPAVVITFDDGYADNVLEALPILEEMRVPATFFISTGRLGTDRGFWWHLLEGMLLPRDGEFPASFTLNDARYGGAWKTTSFDQRQVLYTALNARMLRVNEERRKAWLDQLKVWRGVDRVETGKHRSINPAELKRLAANPLATIGAHTVTHSSLSALDEDEQREEIFTSKQDLESMIGKKITTFSYPFGRKRDYDRTSVRLCREAGFLKAASNFPGQVHRWTDPLQLPRHLVRDWDLETFAAELHGFWTR